MSIPTSPLDALIYTMVMASAVDSAIKDEELKRIGDLTRLLPIFAEFEEDRLVEVSRACSTIISGPEGLDIGLEVIRDALPPRLYDTAYALAVEVMMADLSVEPEEIRFLQLLRDRLSLDKLTCAALERSAIARFRSL